MKYTEIAIKAFLVGISMVYVLWVTDTIHIMMGWPYQKDYIYCRKTTSSQLTDYQDMLKLIIKKKGIKRLK